MESTKSEDLEKFTVQQLKDELKLRCLLSSGIKSELITRIVKDNIIKLAHGILERLKSEKIRRQSEQLE
ncbi:unnamed protein product [Parnassius mnemosyne]|uniref:SAP domain-containing protein n=1 Tax=Parnassius mnemosyne TaxID=213953 RepID=A0AAV1K6C4_9NEOP